MAGRARRIDQKHARRALFQATRDMTYAQIRERLDSDRKFLLNSMGCAGGASEIP